MTIFKRLVFFLVAFVLGAGVLLAFFHQSGLFEVRRIPVEIVEDPDGKSQPGESIDGLKERLKTSIKKHVGRKIWEIDLDEMRASLIKDEWVRDVLISRSLPNGIGIQVVPKTAVAILISEKGEFLPVTEEGALLKELPAGRVPDVPVLRGEIFLTNLQRRKEVVQFAAILFKSGSLSAANVSEISWSESEGYSLTLVQPKVEVKLGEERIELKAMRVAQVLNYLSTNNLKGRVIDASFSKKVLVRLRKGP